MNVYIDEYAFNVQKLEVAHCWESAYICQVNYGGHVTLSTPSFWKFCKRSCLHCPSEHALHIWSLSVPMKLCVAIWLPGYTPARRQTSVLLWTSDHRRPSAQTPSPSPACHHGSYCCTVAQLRWLVSALRTMKIVQLLKCTMCIAWTFSTSPQKPPTTYTRVNDFRPHRDSLFRGATYMRERLKREYIRYIDSPELSDLLTFLLFLPVLHVHLTLELFVYLCL